MGDSGCREQIVPQVICFQWITEIHWNNWRFERRWHNMQSAGRLMLSNDLGDRYLRKSRCRLGTRIQINWMALMQKRPLDSVRQNLGRMLIASGTTHGSPYGYDSHVPLIVYGPQVVPGSRMDRVTPSAIAPIFAQALRTKPPSTSSTSLPSELFIDTEIR